MTHPFFLNSFNGIEENLVVLFAEDKALLGGVMTSREQSGPTGQSQKNLLDCLVEGATVVVMKVVPVTGLSPGRGDQAHLAPGVTSCCLVVH
jgi:hypothetical protein